MRFQVYKFGAPENFCTPVAHNNLRSNDDGNNCTQYKTKKASPSIGKTGR